MKCLRCGNCCKKYLVVIVDNPNLGPVENNLLVNEGNSPCQHLIGDKPGNHSCKIHDFPWFKNTPCGQFTQVESKDSFCRIGEFILKKEEI